MRSLRVFALLLISLLIVPSVSVASQESPGRGEGVQGSQIIESNEMIELLEQKLQKTLQLSDDMLEVKDLRGADKVVLPSGLFSCEVILPERIGRGGPFSATLVFSVDGKEAKRTKVTARVDLYAEVVVAKRYLQRHHEIDEKDVQTMRKNLASLPSDVLTDVKEAVSMRTTSSINGQEVLRKSLIQPPPLIRKGERIMMLVENNRFKIVTWGEVKEDGRKGDQVKVVNLSSKKEVIGRVLSAGAVMVEY